MEPHDEIASQAEHRERGLLSRIGTWLRRDAGEDPAPAAERDTVVSPRLLVLGDIADFLQTYDLGVSHANLALAYDCVTGNDPRLAALLVARRMAGEAVTPEWLAEVRRGPQPEEEMKAMSSLMERLATNIDSFARTTVEAREATSEYQTALRGQVEELHEIGKTGAAIVEMVSLARTMMERSREMEDQLARSERETRILQRSLDEARRTAEVDHLTGLPNRRAFEARLDKEVVAARASGEPLCVAFCDIDRFKRINDTHGHEAGDRVLKVVAHALNDISSERCHVSRHGGEEFVVLFRGKTLDEAFAELDHLRDNLADRRMVNRATDRPFGKVSFSGGIAAVLDYPDPRSALKAADEALYVAKEEGRNRIVRAPARLTLVASNKAA